MPGIQKGALVFVTNFDYIFFPLTKVSICLRSTDINLSGTPFYKQLKKNLECSRLTCTNRSWQHRHNQKLFTYRGRNIIKIHIFMCKNNNSEKPVQFFFSSLMLAGLIEFFILKEQSSAWTINKEIEPTPTGVNPLEYILFGISCRFKICSLLCDPYCDPCNTFPLFQMFVLFFTPLDKCHF